MKLNELSPAAGSKKSVKRVGRGHGSGWGKTAGKGHKGQNARSGGGVRPGFEGGQTPLARRLPKLPGFRNINRVEYVPVNVKTLEEMFYNCTSLVGGNGTTYANSRTGYTYMRVDTTGTPGYLTAS